MQSGFSFHFPFHAGASKTSHVFSPARRDKLTAEVTAVGHSKIKRLAVFLALTAVAGFLFSRDFNKYFVIFHHIFFNNNLWILDPAEDYMIRMLPEDFFYDMVMRIGSIFAVFLIVSFVCSIVQKKINKRCGSR